MEKSPPARLHPELFHEQLWVEELFAEHERRRWTVDVLFFNMEQTFRKENTLKKK